MRQSREEGQTRGEESSSRFCEWTGNHSDIVNHVENDCQFVLSDCINKGKGCDARLLKSEMADGTHVCPAVCPTCKHTFHVDAMEAHKVICDATAIKCTNSGCVVEFCRKNKPSHEAECPHAMVDCPFAVHGCKVNGTGKVTRNAMDAHQANAAIAHSLLLTEQITTLRDGYGAQLLQGNDGGKVTVAGAFHGFEWELDYDALKQERVRQPGSRPSAFSTNSATISALPGYVFRGYAQLSGEGLALGMQVDGGKVYPVNVTRLSIDCCYKTEMLSGNNILSQSGSQCGWSDFFTAAEADARSANGKMKITINLSVSVEADSSKQKQQDFGEQLFRVLGGEKVTVTGAFHGFEWELDYDALKQERVRQPGSRPSVFSTNSVTISALPGYKFRGYAELSDEGLALGMQVHGGKFYPVNITRLSIDCCHNTEMLSGSNILSQSGIQCGWSDFFTAAEADARSANGKMKITINLSVSVEAGM
jgi:hypothetical protein